MGSLGGIEPPPTSNLTERSRKFFWFFERVINRRPGQNCSKTFDNKFKNTQFMNFFECFFCHLKRLQYKKKRAMYSKK